MRYTYPKIDLLEKQLSEEEINSIYIESTKDIIQGVFDAFSIECKIVSHTKSPLSVIYELEANLGVQVRAISKLKADIEVSLGTPVKIYQSDISGKLSIAVPHAVKELVRLRTVLEPDLQNKKPLLITSGIDENGIPLSFDLDDAPHMLIAGSSGTGKTVFIDDIIINILYKASPEEVKILLIDPAGTDFRVYSNIPHLICPVLYNKAEIADALGVITEEIGKRNNIMSAVGEKDYLPYIQKHKSDMPRIVVIVDKFMELSFETPKKVKENLKRISALGRSAGIHLIINTQSPTNNVVPGGIKGNLHNRISFSLPSSSQSISALTNTGAEKLLGNGDMIFYNTISKKSYHAQSAYISYNEIKRIVEYTIKSNEPVEYAPEFENIHHEYAILDDVNMMKRILEAIRNDAQISVGDIQKKLNVPMAEAYEIISSLMMLKFISPVSRGKHDVYYSEIMATLKQMDTYLI